MDRAVPESAVSGFFTELRHRDVYRTGAAYAAAAFVLWQAADIALPALGFPPSAMTVLVVAGAAGFPIALVLAWLYEVVPDRSRRPRPGAGRRLAALGRSIPIALGCIGIVACGGVAWWIVPHEKLALGEGGHLLIADFDNRTGDSIFDGSLASALGVGLTQSPHVSLLPRTWVQGALREMRLPEDAPLDEGTAVEVGLRTGVGAVLLPSISRVGDRFHLATRLVDPETGSTVVARSTTARGTGEVLAALDDLARQLRADLGESLGSLVKVRVPLDRATTASLDALRAWSAGNRHWAAGRQREAGLLYTRAVELDSTFAVAHSDLGQFFYWVRGNPVDGAEHMEAALRHSAGATHRERLVIQGKAAEWKGDRETAISAYRAAAEAHPRDPVIWGNLGYQYLRLGRHDEAIAAYEEAVAHDSLDANGWLNLATLYSAKGESARAVDVYEKAFALAPGFRTVNNINHEYGFTLIALDRIAEAERTFGLLIGGDVAQRAQGLRSRALLRVRQGRFGQAVADLRQAVTLTTATGSYVSDLRNRVFLIETLQISGEPAERELEEARTVAIRQQVPSYFLSHLGSRLVQAGQLPAAREVLDSARARVDQGGESWAAVARLAGEIAAAEGDDATALEQFNAALAYRPDDRAARYALAVFNADRDKLAEARAQLESLLSPDRLIGDESLVPTILAHYHLGRLLEVAGRPEEAIGRYRRFLDYWGGSGLEVVAQARARVSALASD